MRVALARTYPLAAEMENESTATAESLLRI